jgi:acetyl esterase/lipase
MCRTLLCKGDDLFTAALACVAVGHAAFGSLCCLLGAFNVSNAPPNMTTTSSNGWRHAVSKWALTIVCFGMIGLWLSGCSPLAAYNTLAPADAGGAPAQIDITYGQHPRQKLDVYVPSDRRTGVPVVVVAYGGSWNSGSKNDYAFLGKALASRGFVAVIADYRLVPEVRFPAFLDDTAAAAAWALTHAAQYGGDTGRLFVLGHSAGAYNAVMIALDGQYLAHFGARPSQIRGVIGLAGPYDFLPLAVDATKAAFGQAKDLAETQPINFASRNAPPMLLATGDDDTTVYPRNSVALAKQLTAAGGSATVRRYPGIGHVGLLLALSRPLRGRAPVLEDIVKFINSAP